MRGLPDISIRRPVFAAMLIVALVVVGSASYTKLSVDRFPAVDLPIVSIRATLRGASPEEMETEVIQPIERAVNTVEGIEEMRSFATVGSGFVSLTFSLDRDVDVAAQDVRDRVATVIRDLPPDTDPPFVWKADNDAQPVLTVALWGRRSIRELSEIADKIVREPLERSRGVGQVRISGDLQRTISVRVEAAKLASYQIPITAVRDAIVRQNADVPGGNVTGAVREQTLRTMGRFTDPAEFNDLVVATVNGAPIRIRDIGRAEDATREQRSIARLNGVPAVTLEIQRQSKANTVDVIEAAKATLQRVQELLPPDVNMEVILDQSRYIYSALHEINVHLILGSIFASLVVLAFMRNWRSTLIAAVAIPSSVVSTFGMMWALGFTLNSVTMLALVLMVGVVIDDAIVVLENIFRFIEEKKMNAFEAARAATREIALAVSATTLSLVVIFVPVSFMSSISGRFLYQFGITAAVAVMVSLLVSFTLTPMMSARMLRVKDAADGHDQARSRRGFYRIIDAVYLFLLARAMKWRFAVVLLALGVVAGSYPLYRMVRQDYIPTDVDEGEFQVNVTGTEGATLQSMIAAMDAIESDIARLPAVRLMLTTVGSGFSGSLNNGRIYVRIAPHSQRTVTLARLWEGLRRGDPLAAFRGNYTQRDVVQQVRGILRRYGDVRGRVSGIGGFNIGGGPGVAINFVLGGSDLTTLVDYAERLRQMTLPQGESPPQIPGIVDADTSLRLDKPELRVVIDRARAADLGVDARDIGTALRLMVGGDPEVSRFYDPALNEVYDVELRLEEADRGDANAVWGLYLPRRGGGLVQLSSLASIQAADSPSRIERFDRQRTVSLRANIAPGYALADRLAALRKAVDEMGLPPGYTVRVSGQGRELERTFNEFIAAFILSIIFMYIILASQFESLLHPFTILLSLPLAVPFALLSLYLTGGTLNLYSALGILVLFGVVKKNAILQIDHMNNLRQQGMPRLAAIMQANRDRLRPILMTTLSLVAGMMPLALGSGPGAEERRAVAIVVIGGQSLSLLLTLLVTPVAYSLFDDIGLILRRLLGRRVGRDEPRPGRRPAPAPVTSDAL